MNKDTDKETNNEEWYNAHKLSPEQLQQLIRDKFARAILYHTELPKRETKLTDRR